MKRRFEEKRIDRLQQLVNEVVALSSMEEETIECDHIDIFQRFYLTCSCFLKYFVYCH